MSTCLTVYATLPEASAVQPPCQPRKHSSVGSGGEREKCGSSTDLETITVDHNTPQVGRELHKPCRGFRGKLASAFGIPRVEAESAQALERPRINLQVALRASRKGCFSTHMENRAGSSQVLTRVAGDTVTKRSSSSRQLSHSLLNALQPTRNSRRSRIRSRRAWRAMRCSSNGSKEGAAPLGWCSQTRRRNSSGAYVMALRTHLYRYAASWVVMAY